MGVAFRGLPVGRSQWRLPQSRDRGLRGSTHCGYCVHGSHLLLVDHDHWDVSTPGDAVRNRHYAGCRPAVERAVTAARVWDERLSAASSSTSPIPIQGAFSLTELDLRIALRPARGQGRVPPGMQGPAGLTSPNDSVKECKIAQAPLHSRSGNSRLARLLNRPGRSDDAEVSGSSPLRPTINKYAQLRVRPVRPRRRPPHSAADEEGLHDRRRASEAEVAASRWSPSDAASL
jgi:hypothetical protein